MRGDNRHAFATRAVHGGGEPDPTTGAVTTPIYATSTYAQESPGVHKGYAYARTRNPTREALERCLADLENGSVGFAFASGSAAIATVLECLGKDAHVIATDDLYGGTFRPFDRVRKHSAGLEVSLVDMSDPRRVEAAIGPQTKLIWVETADQSAAEAGRSLGHRRDRPTARCVDRGRQHFCQPMGAEAARSRV
jgi:cystathionine gamma-lyase